MTFLDKEVLISTTNEEVKINYKKINFLAKLYGETIIKYNKDLKLILKLEDKIHEELIKQYHKDLKCETPEI